jgi:hypothetical protein
MKTEYVRLRGTLIFARAITDGDGIVLADDGVFEFTRADAPQYFLMRNYDEVSFTPNPITGMAEDVQPIQELHAKPPSRGYLSREAARRKAGRPRLSIVA